MMGRRLWIWLGAMACGALVTACSDDDTTGGGGSAGAGASTTGTAGTDTGTATGTGGGTTPTGNTGGSPSLSGCTIFPPDNPWNTDISNPSEYPVHPNSDNFIDSIGRDQGFHADFGTEWQGAPNGIPYVVVPGAQPLVPINFTAYGPQSDPGPYPVPPDAPVEGGPDGDGDRHVLVIEAESCTLYEMFYAWPQNGGASWDAHSGAVFDLTINDDHPETWTSADAAGLPIFPGLVRYEEVVEQGVVNHALRFTVSQSQAGYIPPAMHYASSSTDPNHPPMGLRLRMKASYDCSGLADEIQVLCTAFKTYGLIVADNGTDWYVSGAPNPAWDDDALHDIDGITGDAFEVVYTGDIRTY